MVHLLRAECDVLARRVDLGECDCMVDPLGGGGGGGGGGHLADGSQCRVSRRAFLAKRAEVVSAGAAQCADADFDDVHAAVEEVLFTLLPAALRALTGCAGGAGGAGPVYLFNQHYVVKGPRSDSAFGWHTDAEEQLALCLTAQARAQEYVSFWCPLDDCGAPNTNGTLVVQPGFAEPPGSDADDAAGSDDGEQHDRGAEGVTISAAAGDVCAFSSRLWHASGPNRSCAVRRVFYAQYSAQPLADGSRDPNPISLAVPCQ